MTGAGDTFLLTSLAVVDFYSGNQSSPGRRTLEGDSCQGTMG